MKITFRNGIDGHQVQLLASETLEASGGVNPHGTDSNFHYDTWTLADGVQTVDTHEYIEARYWQVNNSPEPPDVSIIAGWKAFIHL